VVIRILSENQGIYLVSYRSNYARNYWLLCAEIGVVNQPKNFGASLPGVYRQCAVAYTDFWESYKTVIPSKRHRPVGQETGQTNPIERLNNTFRQRISRLVRDSLSFSKKMENHVGEPFGILSMTTMHSKAKD
jgi:insertion element IS1 protein InsB